MQQSAQKKEKSNSIRPRTAKTGTEKHSGYVLLYEKSSALRYYGLIPEAAYIMQSMTLKHSRNFNTPIGRFEYTYIPREAFTIGLSSMRKEEYTFLIATPEKALCDLIACSPQVNLRYLKDAEAYIEEDIRMEIEELRQMDTRIFEAYIPVGKKAESIRTLLKLIKR